MDDKCLRVIGEKLGTTLEYINLEACRLVSDLGVSFLANSCPKLTVLRLKNCRDITNRSIEAVAKNCPLNTLHLAGCNEVTNYGLDCLATYSFATLERLSLMGLSNITDDGLEKLIKACSQLSQLDLMNCRQISLNLKLKLSEIDVSKKSVFELKW